MTSAFRLRWPLENAVAQYCATYPVLDEGHVNALRWTHTVWASTKTRVYRLVFWQRRAAISTMGGVASLRQMPQQLNAATV